MKVREDIVFSWVDESTEKELNELLSFFTFELKNENDKCLINDEGKLYSGLIPFLKDKGLRIEVSRSYQFSGIPAREIVVDESILEGKTLRDYQIVAVKKALFNGRGILEMPTGSGKTATIAAVIQHYKMYAKVDTFACVTPSVFLMQQMADEFEHMGLGEVGRVGGGKKLKGDYDIVIYVVNSAVSHLEKDTPEGRFLRNSQALLLEEAHHAKAKTWIKVCETSRATVRLSFTATAHEDPFKWSYDDLVLVGLTGKIIYKLRSKELRTRGFLAEPSVTFLESSKGVYGWDWKKVYEGGIVLNKERNNKVIALASTLFTGGNKVMIFVGRKKHGHLLCQSLAQLGCESVFVHGGCVSYLHLPSGTVMKNSWSVSDIADYVNSRNNCILCCTQALDEGVNLPSVNTLIMTTGMQKYRRTMQRVGRGMRPKPGNNKVYVFDFWDGGHRYLEKHSRYRMATYESEEYEFSDSLDDTLKEIGCPVALMGEYLKSTANISVSLTKSRKPSRYRRKGY